MKVLHAGCGGAPLPVDYFPTAEETRLDIDPAMKPDVVASLTDMGDIGGFDAVYTAHCLEHLYPHEVPVALGEIRRVLRDGGYAMVIVPDLDGVQPTDDVVYESPCGPISGLDMYYGHSRLIPDHPYMAHHCGFVADTLKRAMEASGFSSVSTRSSNRNLIAIGVKA